MPPPDLEFEPDLELELELELEDDDSTGSVLSPTSTWVPVSPVVVSACLSKVRSDAGVAGPGAGPSAGPGAGATEAMAMLAAAPSTASKLDERPPWRSSACAWPPLAPGLGPGPRPRNRAAWACLRRGDTAAAAGDAALPPGASNRRWRSWCWQ